jgi:hypothetical protein
MVTAAQSFASPTLGHVHNISAAISSDLSQLQCPFSYNMRLENPTSTAVGSAIVFGSWTATTLYVSSVTAGALEVGQILTGTGLAQGTTITAFVTGTGGIGSYTISTDCYGLPPLPQSTSTATAGGIEVSITATAPIPMSFRTEVQTVTCRATSGSFSFIFRGESTELLNPLTCTVANLREALQGLTVIGEVDVSVVAGTDASLICRNIGVQSAVIFLTELGEVPLLIVSGSASSQITITRTRKAAPHALYECGGRGSCDRSVGQCVCWNYWGSSDGFGGPGTLGDCGHTLIY